MRLTGEMTAFQETSRTIEGKRKEAMTAYKKLKKNANNLRESFGKCLIKARAKSRKTSAQEKMLKQAFGQRSMAKRVKRLTGSRRNTIRCVNAPLDGDNGVQTDCFDRTSIEAACMQEGIRRFSQTKNTPLMHVDFVARVGYTAELAGADEILAGTFDPPSNLDPYAVKFLDKLKMQDIVTN
jgi:hypothetical protein